MKIVEAVLTALLKRGIIGELKDFKTEIDIPSTTPNGPPTKLIVSADLLQIKIDEE